jgi:Nuclease-related domain
MPVSSSLRGRIPGQAAMTEVVDAQAGVAQRSRIARFFGQSPLSAATKPMFRAAAGELLVGDMLDNLGPRWDVLHVIPIEGGAKDIDHLVIGPPGVFAIITENFPGQEIRVNGDSLSVGSRQFDEIATARDLGERAARLLGSAAAKPVVVSPLVVIVNPTRLALREPPDGVTVVGSRQLLHHLEKLERTLSGADIASISDVADRDTTWQATPVAAQDVQQLSATFGELKSAVQDATQARVFWAIVGLAVLALCLWVSTAMVVQHVLKH